MQIYNQEQIKALWNNRIEAATLDEAKAVLVQEYGPLPWGFITSNSSDGEADIIVTGLLEAIDREIRPELPFMGVTAIGYFSDACKKRLPAGNPHKLHGPSNPGALNDIWTPAYDAQTKVAPREPDPAKAAIP